ncbi:hypothetical protein HHK36_005404 [Tetracentron sinense]|uniref:Uncharacterized protein n=1 Tax=Tetracentron sinense TaxID=13715 RepID=A0A834ZL05_TETSI|nr:hypothetical protein HHK36_005404 [Tetracentron sinense]
MRGENLPREQRVGAWDLAGEHVEVASELAGETTPVLKTLEVTLELQQDSGSNLGVCGSSKTNHLGPSNFKVRIISVTMGWVGRLAWVNDCSKKHCRSLFWRMRASMKKAVKNGGKQRLNFQYDPSSYALNFDDGCYDLRENSNAFQQTQSKDCPATKNSKWVYVLWVKSY